MCLQRVLQVVEVQQVELKQRLLLILNRLFQRWFRRQLMRVLEVQLCLAFLVRLQVLPIAGMLIRPAELL
ncbi:hypothetical protein D3C85_1437680 [compost metagenome]